MPRSTLRRQMFDNCQLWYTCLHHILFHLHHNLGQSIWNLFSLIICSVWVNSSHSRPYNKPKAVACKSHSAFLLRACACLEFIWSRAVISSLSSFRVCSWSVIRLGPRASRGLLFSWQRQKASPNTQVPSQSFLLFLYPSTCQNNSCGPSLQM